MRFQTVAVILLLILMIGCSKHFSNQPIPNQPPETFVTIIPDSTLRSTTSQQHLHWWGVDPDGFVVGYYISFDNLHWTFTSSNDSVLGLKLTTNDTLYSFYVAAVDDQGLKDPKPASLRMPIHNSPPVVSFVFQSDVPDTTFTVATFQWNGSDVDGNETIVSYYYVLDDTTNPSKWISLPSTSNLVTLFKADGLTEGRHVFYLKARDVAGAYSKMIRMPDTTKTWYVRDPQGQGKISDFLIINDDISASSDGAATFYNQMYDTLNNGRIQRQTRYIWDIKAGYTNTARGTHVPALINPTFTESIKLFKYILWYCDQNPQMNVAQSSLPAFKAAGGKVLMVTVFTQYPPDSRGFGDFAPIDSIQSSYFTSAFLKGDSLIALDPSYPNLYSGSTFLSYQRGVWPKVNSHLLYKMGKSPRWADTNIVMGVQDADNPSIVFLSLQLQRFVGSPGTGIPDNTPVFLRKVFYNEFGVR